MDDLRARLIDAFAAVFPDLPPDEVERASPATVPGWDSLANVTLVSVIEEEFGVEIPPDDLETLRSFDHVLRYLQRAAPDGERADAPDARS